MRIQTRILLVLILLYLSLKAEGQPPAGTLPSSVYTGNYYKWLHWGEYGEGLSLVNSAQPKINGVFTYEHIGISNVSGDPTDMGGYMGGLYYSAINERFFVSFRRNDPNKTFIGFTIDTSHGLYYTHLSGDPMFQVDTSGQIRMLHLPYRTDPNYIGGPPNGMLYIDPNGWVTRGPLVTGGGGGGTEVAYTETLVGTKTLISFPHGIPGGITPSITGVEVNNEEGNSEQAPYADATNIYFKYAIAPICSPCTWKVTVTP